jgi:3-isopropylmalate/(R)-2-methylmalate dehydratase large subunit
MEENQLMAMTLTEKILAAGSGQKSVSPGQLIQVKLDLVMANDATFPVSLREFRDRGFSSVFDSERIVLVMDHFTPNKDIKAAENCRLSREFAHEYHINHFYDTGKVGVEHALLPELGLVKPGDIIIGGDSHTCTYGALGAFSTGVGSTDVVAGIVTGEAWLKVPETIRIDLHGRLKRWVSGKDVILSIIAQIGVAGATYQALEFHGPGLTHLSMDDRFTIANMAIEAGAKNGIFPVDDITFDYLKKHTEGEFPIYEADSDAVYSDVLEIELDAIPLLVSLPHSPANVRPVKDLDDTEIDEVLIGSCTNGRISDMEVAAEILKGKQVADGVRALIIPATPTVYQESLRRGYLESFLEAGCAVSTPTCGACGGGHMGLLGAGERVLSTSNRNFVGRMGHIRSEIYLCNPAVAAASAIAGKIAQPD